MELTPNLNKAYTSDHMSAREAQRIAHLIAFAPVVFQVSGMMLKYGIFDMLRDSEEGLTISDMVEKSHLSEYAIKLLIESSLTTGTVYVDADTERYHLAKMGWFLLTDKFVRVNFDFNADVNYLGLASLEEALLKGYPAGLKTFGTWNTIYEGLSELPEQAKKSWFAFDHCYSDGAFAEALKIVFAKEGGVRKLLDIGGNTGKWALQCVGYNDDVEVTIMDLGCQLATMREFTKGKKGADRIKGFEINVLDESRPFPDEKFDAIWMSQFLDCFAPEQIVSILKRASRLLADGGRIYIMETLWNRQKYEPSAFCLAQTSPYFTAMANGNSKMYSSDDFIALIEKAGCKVESVSDNLGFVHSLIICDRK